MATVPLLSVAVSRDARTVKPYGGWSARSSYSKESSTLVDTRYIGALAVRYNMILDTENQKN